MVTFHVLHILRSWLISLTHFSDFCLLSHIFFLRRPVSDNTEGWQMLDASLVGDNPFSCVLKYPELLCYESVSSYVVLMASQCSVEAKMSFFPTGESGGRGTTPPRDIKVRRITAVLLCQHTHPLSLSRLPRHLLCQINLDVSQVHNSIAISTAWSSERKRALWEDFPPRLRPSWFSIINMLICELRSDEW